MNTATADGSRALYGISQDGMTIKWFGRLNRYHVPANAMTLDAVLNIFLLFTYASEPLGARSDPDPLEPRVRPPATCPRCRASCRGDTSGSMGGVRSNVAIPWSTSRSCLRRSTRRRWSGGGWNPAWPGVTPARRHRAPGHRRAADSRWCRTSSAGRRGQGASGRADRSSATPDDVPPAGAATSHTPTCNGRGPPMAVGALLASRGARAVVAGLGDQPLGQPGASRSAQASSTGCSAPPG